jgi:saccharopepsin
MFPASCLISLAFLAVSLCGTASAIPTAGVPQTLSFRAHINATGTGNIVEADRARIAAFKNDNARRDLGKRSGSIDVTNAVVTYTASVGIGSPATDYSKLCWDQEELSLLTLC